MNPLYEPASNPVLEADHLRRHAIKDVLVELIEAQEPITRKSAQRAHGWKFEKLLLAKGYAIVPAAALAATGEATTPAPVATPATGVVGEVLQAAYGHIDAIEEAWKEAANATPTDAHWLMKKAIEEDLPAIQRCLYQLATPAAPGPAALATTGEAAAGWVAVSERLPKSDTAVLVAANVEMSPGHFRQLVLKRTFYYDEDDRQWYRNGGPEKGKSQSEITHWQPLPAAPVMPAGPATHV